MNLQQCCVNIPQKGSVDFPLESIQSSDFQIIVSECKGGKIFLAKILCPLYCEVLVIMKSFRIFATE